MELIYEVLKKNGTEAQCKPKSKSKLTAKGGYGSKEGLQTGDAKPKSY